MIIHHMPGPFIQIMGTATDLVTSASGYIKAGDKMNTVAPDLSLNCLKSFAHLPLNKYLCANFEQGTT